jgi:hypothetical protein
MKKHAMKIKVLLATCFLSYYSIAQEPQVIIVENPTSARRARSVKPKVDRNVENYNAFKFDPLRMAIGEINFSWETRVGEKTTLEFEAGPTISNLGRNRPEYYDPYYNPLAVHTDPAMGVLLSGAVRYYPLEDYHAMNKLYVSPRIKYRRYNENYVSPVASLSDERGYSNEVIFSFNVGFQQWLSNNFAFDYYIGAGIGSYTASTSSVVASYDENTQSNVYSWERFNEKSARFVGVIGLKVTIGN